MTAPLSRRTIVRGVAAAAATLLAEQLVADPYATPRTARPARRARPVRITGRVDADRRGLAGVAVSDGLTVVRTARDGAFQLLTTDAQPFVFVSPPPHCRLPVSETGTARCYEPIRPNAAGEMSVRFGLEPASVEPRHAFLVLADPQTQDEQEMRWLHEQTVPDVRTTLAGVADRPVFGVACGDIMYDRLQLYPDYERAVQRMGVPFFQVVGNHDLDTDERTDAASVGTFCGRFGPAWYSFERGEVHYVVLDDVFWHGAGYLGYLDAPQLTWLAADLAAVERGRTVVAFTHIPVLGSQHLRAGRRRPEVSMAIQNREALYRLLEPYRAHIVVGHTHENEHVLEHGVHEHVAGTVCGAWWSGPICHDGTPNGYAVYDVSGPDLTWRYKSTGQPAQHQMRLYPHGADPRAPDEVVANVWDWDPAWSVTWFEDGERRGPMARRTGLDPLAVELHTGPEKPPRRTWVEPVPTAHLFYAPATRTAREVRVEARDRFGRVYTDVLR